MRTTLLHPSSETPDDMPIEQVRLPWNMRRTLAAMCLKTVGDVRKSTNELLLRSGLHRGIVDYARHAGLMGKLGEAMPRKKSDEGINMAQRTVLQYLSPIDWKDANRLPIPAGEMILSRLAHLGWIEMRGENQRTEIILTAAGLKAMRSPIV